MWGLDMPGLCRYGKIALRSWPTGWALNTFSGTFGDSRAAVEAIIKSEKCPRVEIKLMWKDNHSFSSQDFSAIKKEAVLWKPLTLKYPQIEWQICGATEHNLSLKDAQALKEIVLDVLPNAAYVNNPMKQGVNDLPLIERHGADVTPPKRMPYNFSFDGSSAVDSDVTAIKDRLKDAETFFFWIPQFNLKKSMADTTPRPQRTCKPTVELIESVAYLANDRGAVKLPPNWLMKSHAEETTDARSNKPVFIVPLKTKQLTLKKDGKEVATCPYFGTYVDGRHRYYSPMYGYQISELYGIVEVWADGKKVGTCNLAFRQGSFR